MEPTDPADTPAPVPPSQLAANPMKYRILVTAGPTFEPIDAIRFLGNRSTGKMGFALAGVAAAHGHEVRLITGPVHLDTPPAVVRTDLETAQQMFDAVRDAYAWCEVLIMAAAVADWRPAEVLPGKMKKHDGERQVRLVRTRDILHTLGRTKGTRYLVGFAAESSDLEAQAARKLQNKNLDLIVANHVMEADAAFGADTNRVVMLWPNGRRLALPVLDKSDVAERILEQIECDLNRRDQS